jgi:hypothetical protein
MVHDYGSVDFFGVSMALTEADYKLVHEAIKLSRISQASLAKNLAIDPGYFSQILTGKRVKAEDLAFEQDLLKLVTGAIRDADARGAVNSEVAEKLIESLGVLREGRAVPKVAMPGSPISEVFDNFVQSSLVESSINMLGQSSVSVICTPIMSGKTTAINAASRAAISDGLQLLHVDCSGLTRGLSISKGSEDDAFMEFASRFVASLAPQVDSNKALESALNSIKLFGGKLAGSSLGEIVVQILKRLRSDAVGSRGFLLVMDSFESIPLVLCLDLIDAIRNLVNLVAVHRIPLQIYIATPRHFQRIAEANQNPDNESAISWLFVGSVEEDGFSAGWFREAEVVKLADVFGSGKGKELFQEAGGQPYLTQCYLHSREKQTPADYFTNYSTSSLLDRFVKRAKSAKTEVNEAHETLQKLGAVRESRQMKNKMLRDNITGGRQMPPAVRKLLKSMPDVIEALELDDAE